jgi:hypothetical protein
VADERRDRRIGDDQASDGHGVCDDHSSICRTSANRLLRSTSRPSFHTAQWKVYGLLTAPE